MSRPALRVIIVEDQVLIAKQIEMIVLSAGHIVVGTADNRDAACDLAVATSPDIAFVDLSLTDGVTGIDVAITIAQRCDARVIFTTANGRRLPPDFCGAIGLVEKPFSRAGLSATLHYLAATMRDGEAGAATKPDTLVLSPTYTDLWRDREPRAPARSAEAVAARG